jgi:hypothetical protein
MMRQTTPRSGTNTQKGPVATLVLLQQALLGKQVIRIEYWFKSALPTYSEIA